MGKEKLQLQENARTDHGTQESLCARWLAILAVVIAYGSLLPFDLSSARFFAANGSLLGLTLHPPTLDDAITNLAIYVPIGLVFGLTLGRRIGIALRAALFGLVLSLAIECLQVGATMRVPSWIDVLLNTAGALTGIPLSFLVAGAFARMRVSWHRRPYATLTGLLTVGLLVANLFPLNLVTDSATMWDGFLQARWKLQDAFAPVSGASPFEPVAAAITHALSFIALGYVSALAGVEVGRRTDRAMLDGVSRGVTVLVVIAVFQVFDQDRPIDLIGWLLGALSVTAGAWAGSFLPTGGRAYAVAPPLRQSFSTPMIVGLLALQGLAWLIKDFSPSEVHAFGIDLAAIRLLPFKTLWMGEMWNATQQVLAAAAAAAAFAWPCLVVVRRLGIRYSWTLVAGAVALLNLVRVLLASASLSDTADLTWVVVAAFTVLLLATLERGLHPMTAEELS